MNPELPDPHPLRFIGGRGAELAGMLHRPAGEAKGSVLLAHCFTCSKDIFTMTRLARGLAEAGYLAFRFDFTGRGESGGDFADKTVSGNVSDLVRAATALITENVGPCIMIGHSLGGAAVLLAAERVRTVTEVITIGAPSDVAHVTHLFADDLDELRAAGRAEVCITGRTFELDRGFVDDLVEHDVLAAAAALGRPYLTIHATDDDVVGFANAEALHAAATEPKRLLALPSGGHMFAPKASTEAVLAGILAFLDEHRG